MTGFIRPSGLRWIAWHRGWHLGAFPDRIHAVRDLLARL